MMNDDAGEVKQWRNGGERARQGREWRRLRGVAMRPRPERMSGAAEQRACTVPKYVYTVEDVQRARRRHF